MRLSSRQRAEGSDLGSLANETRDIVCETCHSIGRPRNEIVDLSRVRVFLQPSAPIRSFHRASPRNEEYCGGMVHSQAIKNTQLVQPQQTLIIIVIYWPLCVYVYTCMRVVSV